MSSQFTSAAAKDGAWGFQQAHAAEALLAAGSRGPQPLVGALATGDGAAHHQSNATAPPVACNTEGLGWDACSTAAQLGRHVDDDGAKEHGASSLPPSPAGGYCGIDSVVGTDSPTCESGGSNSSALQGPSADLPPARAAVLGQPLLRGEPRVDGSPLEGDGARLSSGGPTAEGNERLSRNSARRNEVSAALGGLNSSERTAGRWGDDATAARRFERIAQQLSEGYASQRASPAVMGVPATHASATSATASSRGALPCAAAAGPSTQCAARLPPSTGRAGAAVVVAPTPLSSVGADEALLNAGDSNAVGTYHSSNGSVGSSSNGSGNSNGGGRPLPPQVSSGIAQLAMLMAGDDVIRSRVARLVPAVLDVGPYYPPADVEHGEAEATPTIGGQQRLPRDEGGAGRPASGSSEWSLVGSKHQSNDEGPSSAALSGSEQPALPPLPLPPLPHPPLHVQRSSSLPLAGTGVDAEGALPSHRSSVAATPTSEGWQRWALAGERPAPSSSHPDSSWGTPSAAAKGREGRVPSASASPPWGLRGDVARLPSALSCSGFTFPDCSPTSAAGGGSDGRHFHHHGAHNNVSGGPPPPRTPVSDSSSRLSAQQWVRVGAEEVAGQRPEEEAGGLLGQREGATVPTAPSASQHSPLDVTDESGRPLPQHRLHVLGQDPTSLPQAPSGRGRVQTDDGTNASSAFPPQPTASAPPTSAGSTNAVFGWLSAAMDGFLESALAAEAARQPPTAARPLAAEESHPQQRPTQQGLGGAAGSEERAAPTPTAVSLSAPASSSSPARVAPVAGTSAASSATIAHFTTAAAFIINAAIFYTVAVRMRQAAAVGGRGAVKTTPSVRSGHVGGGRGAPAVGSDFGFDGVGGVDLAGLGGSTEESILFGFGSPSRGQAATIDFGESVMGHAVLVVRRAWEAMAVL